LNVHTHLDALIEAAQNKKHGFEIAHLSNDVIFQGWIISACNQLKGQFSADAEIPDHLVPVVTQKVELIGETLWEGGRQKVIAEIGTIISAPVARAAE
jgi:hypothetical protein